MKSILLNILLVTGVTVSAQNAKYSLPQLLQKVAVDYPTVKAKQANISAANYYLAASKKDLLPDLTVGDQYQYSTDNGLEGSYYSNEGTTISTSGGIRSHDIYQPVFGSLTSVMINWHAFDFGKVKEETRLSQSKIDLARADYTNEVFKQQVKVIDAYLLYVLSQKLVSVQENNLRRSEVFRQYVLSHTESGLLPGVDSSSANAEVAKAQLALLQSQQFVEEQKNTLEQLGGVSADSIRVDTTAFLHTIPSFNTPTSSIDNNPFIQYERQRLATQYNQLGVLKKSVLPTINVLGAGWARGSGVDRVTKAYSTSIIDGLPYRTYNYLAGVAVKWNITSLVKNREQYLGAIQELESTRFKIEEERSILNREIKNAELQYESALQQARVTPVQFKAALDAFNSSNARYQSGLTSLNEVIQAYYVLNRADVDNAVAINNVWRAILQHAASTGNISEITSQLPQ
ncbi:MAG: TolC family protein [Flavisolibacter sp.]